MPRTGTSGGRLWPVLSGILIVLLALVAVGCGGGTTQGAAPGFFPPPAASEQGRHIQDLYSIVFWIAAAVFLLVEGLILWAVLRYRRRDDVLPVQTHGSRVAEALWTAIPAAIVLFLFILTVQTLDKVEAKTPNPAVTVDVTGFQWQWTFDYKEQGLSFTGLGDKGPEMVLPVGQTVHLKLHSNDVIHAFYVPQFLYKKDVVPGRENNFDVLVEQPGTYVGQCAEFCGLAHAKMFFTVRAVPRAEFDAWVSQEQEKAKATPSPAASGSAGGGGGGAPALAISASSAAGFDTPAVEGRANQPLTIQFENKDPSAPHNVAIKQATPEGDFVGQPLAQAGQKATYMTPPLAAGQYTFYCAVHPNMQGTLTVR